MTILTKEQVTNLFLYGTEEKPTDLTDEALLTRAAGSTTISEALFMSEIWGGGKLNFSMFEHVRRFLQGEGSFSSGPKTQAQVLAEFGLSPENYHIEKQLVDYNDGSEDFYEKVYIWNTGRFILHDNVRFIVESNGDRRIENLAIVTFDSENFDFVTTPDNGLPGRLGNALFESAIDPQGIGQTVTINFNRDITEFRQQYVLSDLNSDLQSTIEISSTGHYMNRLAFAINGVTDIIPALTSVISDPAVQIVDGRKVIYGTSQSDELYSTLYSDRGSIYFGVHFVAGNSDDILYGSIGSDVFEGGIGNDTYVFNSSASFGNDFIVSVRPTTPIL